MIEEGAWKSRACEAALGYTGGRNRQIAVDFVLLEGPNEGEHITWYGYFTDDTWERTIDSLRIMGWSGADLDDLSGIDANEVRLVIAHDEYNGEVFARVRWVNTLGGIAMKERMDPAAARSFAAEMKGRILAHGAKQGTPRKQQQRPTPAPTPADAESKLADDTDIPF